MKKGKRILALMLAVIMAFSLISVSAFAGEGSVSYSREAEPEEKESEESSEEQVALLSETDAVSESDQADAEEAAAESLSSDDEEKLQESQEAESPVTEDISEEASETLNTLSGQGTEEDPYLIATAEDLKEFRDLVNGVTAADDAARTASARLTADIVLDSTVSWTPISTAGAVANQYGGTFDGDGHKISGLYINSQSTNQGLFGTANGATIKNLKVEGSVTSSKNYVGGIVGKIQADTSLVNCSFSGSVACTMNSTSAYAGGIASYVNSTGCSFTGCVNYASVTSVAYAAGILTNGKKSCSISNCYNAGAIKGSNCAGITAYFKAGTLKNCFNVGDISTEGTSCGGIFSWSAVNAANCYYTSPAESKDLGGGGTDGTKVEFVSASDLGDAFKEGTDHPLLTWEEGGSTSSKAVVNITVSESDGVTITFNGSVLTGSSVQVDTAGDYTLVVEKDGFLPYSGTVTVSAEQIANSETIEYPVLLCEKEISSLTVSGNESTYYVGDTLSNLVVTVHYADGTERVVTDYSVSGFDSTKAAEEETVVITYGLKQVSFKVAIEEKKTILSPLSGFLDVENSGTYYFPEDEANGWLVSNNQGKGSSSAVMTLTALKDLWLDFDYKISSEKNYDWLNIEIDGNSVGGQKVSGWSGTVDWTSWSGYITKGSVVKISYIKDTSTDGNDDCVYLKNFAARPVYHVTFNVSPSDQAAVTVYRNDPDSDETVELTDGQGSTWAFTGTVSYKATAFGCYAKEGQAEVKDGDITETIVLEKKPTHKLTFNLSLPEGLSDAYDLEVQSDGYTVEPQSDGSYVIPEGTVSWRFILPSYEEMTGTTDMTGDTVITIDEKDMVYLGEPWDGTSKSEPDKKDDVYQISNARELAWFAARVNGGDNAIKGILTDNINLDGFTWTSVGDYSNPFLGTLDGKGYIVSGLMNAPLIGYLGKSGSTEGTVKNLVVSGYITASSNVGGIVGTSYGLIDSCSMSGEIVSTSSSFTGGIAGRTQENAVTRNCVNYATILYNGTLYYDASLNIGGIAGYAYGTVANCYNMGNVSVLSSSNGKAVGGVIGSVRVPYSSGSTTVSNCYNAGSVSGGSSPMAVLGEKAEKASVENCYYLDTTGSDVNAVSKTADEMKSDDFVTVLCGTAGYVYYKDSDNISQGYPVLAWQGGTKVVDEDAEKIASDKASLTIDTSDITENKTLSLPATGEKGSVITWSSNHEAITPEGVASLPESGAAEVTLTATIRSGSKSDTKTFAIRVVSKVQQAQEQLDETASYLDGKAIWAQEILYPDEQNIVDTVKRYFGDKLTEDVTVTMTSAGKKTLPGGDKTVNLADDGTITYFTGDGSNSSHYALYDDVVFKLSGNGAESAFTVRVFISWDKEYVQELVEKAAAALTWDQVKKANTTSGTTTKTDGVVKDVITGYTNSDLYLPTLVNACTVSWETAYNSDYGTVLQLKENLDSSMRYYDCQVTRPAYQDQTVSVIGTLTFNLLNDGEDAPEAAYPSAERIFEFTVQYDPDASLIDKDTTQKNLEEKYEALITNFADKTQAYDKTAVKENLQMPRPSALETAGILLDRSNEKVEMTSGNEKLLAFTGYQAVVYRPLPGEEDAEASYTVTIRDRNNDKVIAEKTFTMTIKALTQKEIDEAAALMKKAAANEVYWEGLKGNNTAKDKVTENLSPFVEITQASDGTLSYIRGVKSFTGITLDEIPGYDDMGSQSWRLIRSSNENAVTCENLLVTRSEYNREVTLDSVMTYERYAKYWTHFAEDESATDETKEKYAQFEQFYKQPVSAAITVLGTTGEEDPNPGPKKVTVSTLAQMEGGVICVYPEGVTVSSDEAESFGYTDGYDAEGSASRVTALDLLVYLHEQVFGEDFTEETAGEYLEVSSSGTVSKLFGVETISNGFMLNDGYAADEDGLGTLVTTTALEDGDYVNYYIYQDQTAWSDEYTFISLETSKDICVGSEFTADLTAISAMSAYNYSTPEKYQQDASPKAGIGFAWMNGETGELTSAEGTLTDKTGRATLTAPKEAGIYYLTVLDTDDTYLILNPRAVLVSDHQDEDGNGICDICGESLGAKVAIYGHNRYETAAAIAREAFPDGGVEEILLVTGEKFPDALAANAYAGACQMPVLLTYLSGLPDAVKTLLTETWGGSVTRAVIVGDGMSEQVIRDLEDCGVENINKTLSRGKNRYETAALITKRGLDRGLFSHDTVILAKGGVAADSLSVASWSYRDQLPILLAKDDGTIPEVTKTQLARFKNVIILGKAATADQVTGCGIKAENITELYGKNRYETSVEIARYFMAGDGGSLDKLSLVLGEDDRFADALAGGMLAGQLNTPLLLVSADLSRAAAAYEYLEDVSDEISVVCLLGAAPQNQTVLDKVTEVTGIKATVRASQWERLIPRPQQ